MEPLLKSIHLRNVLSFGPHMEEPFELKPLNVLIGANASGKSNVLDAIELMRNTPVDIRTGYQRIGGFEELFYKGGSEPAEASIQLGFRAQPGQVLYHFIGWSPAPPARGVEDESLVAERSAAGAALDARAHFRRRRDRVDLRERWSGWDAIDEPAARLVEIDPDQSVLAQIKHPGAHPVLADLSRCYTDGVAMHLDWPMGRGMGARQQQPGDLPPDRLMGDARNLAAVITNLRDRGNVARLMDYLRRFCDRYEDYFPRIEGGSLLLHMKERGLRSAIPATRLSEGTVRWLALLATLLDPDPPRVICLEEPDVGLHPDSIAMLAELLIDASERTQLIVTTHSDILVGALTERPEAVVVVSHHGQGTVLERLDPDKLRDWLKEYSLGDLWLRGRIGGTRW
jgi:predicted ATPase